MAAARLTQAQARAMLAGRDTTKVEQAEPTAPTRRGKTPYHTICVMCRTEFHTRASEDRHVNETSHSRYALVFAEVDDTKGPT